MSTKRDGFNQHVTQIVENLRRMADEIERNAASNDIVDDSAQEIINTVTWGVANLQLGLLVRWTARVMRNDTESPKGTSA